MAAKKKSNANNAGGKGRLIRACSYFALVFAAFLFLFGGIFSGGVRSVLTLIGQLFLLAGIGIPAYDYTRSKKTVWTVIYWVALIVYVAGCIFGVIKGL